MKNRRWFLTLLAGSLLPQIVVRPASGQSKARRVATLSPFPRADVGQFVGALRQDLQKLGWTDGRDVVLLEPRLAEGRNERLPALAAEIVAEAPDVILVQSAPATRALMQATRSVPIVMAGVGNPVEYGIVPELAKPGGNVTGSAFLADESILKLLQLLTEAAPRLRSVAVFANPTNEASAPMIAKLRGEVAAKGWRAQIVEVHGPDDFERALAAIRRENTESIMLPPEPLIRSKREVIGQFARREGLALAVVGRAGQLPEGALIGYAPALSEFTRLAARHVDRILRGVKPGDIPVEQPARFELVINLKTAKALGLTIPPTLLAAADEVIR
jgi:putative ABC transport system substrate-binding protein